VRAHRRTGRIGVLGYPGHALLLRPRALQDPRARLGTGSEADVDAAAMLGRMHMHMRACGQNAEP